MKSNLQDVAAKLLSKKTDAFDAIIKKLEAQDLVIKRLEAGIEFWQRLYIESEERAAIASRAASQDTNIDLICKINALQDTIAEHRIVL